MKMTYWIAEHTSGQADRALRFNTREEFDEHVKKHNLRQFTQKYYDLPREITVEVENVIQIIDGCLNRKDYQSLPWEKR